MCGIVGKLNYDDEKPVSPELLQRMMDQIRHRGPDGEGRYVDGSIGLGHRRLSIIDLDTGGQPMCNEDGTVWVVYNGELYNFPDLRVELKALGHTFKSNTDTEVIVHMYEELGTDSVARFRGMFAFALWDDRKKLLLLARDRVGIKPLYYYNTGKALLFSSEIKALLVDPSVTRRVNLRAIDRFLTYYYLPGNETLFDGIYKLDPGHYLTVCNGQITVQQYWDLHFNTSPRYTNLDDATHDLQKLLRRTVKDHMISDVPVGVLLSGGVDSTSVLSYAVEEACERVRTFTVGFSGEEFADERPFARLAAKRYGTDHQEITIDAGNFREFLPKFVWHMEEPVCEPPAVALYYVSKLVRDSSVKVLLSGEGGDEAFGGYSKYRNILILEGLKAGFGDAKGLLRLGLKTLECVGWKKIHRYANIVNLPLSQYYFSCTAMPDTAFNRKKHLLYSKEFKDFLGQQDSDAPTRYFFEKLNDQSLLNQMLYVDTKTLLPDDLLLKADKMTMATSVELRVPFLDFRVLEFAANLPAHFKVKGWSTKRILKAAIEKIVPIEIIKRKKTGFPVPYDRWMKLNLEELVSDLILGENSSIFKYFNKGAVQKLVQEWQNGQRHSQEIFSLIVLELWHKQFLEGQVKQLNLN